MRFEFAAFGYDVGANQFSRTAMESTGLSWETIAASAYRAYGQSVGNKNHQGLPMPAWEDLPASIQIAWVCAAKHTGSLAPYLLESEQLKGVPAARTPSAAALAAMEQLWAGRAIVTDSDTPRTGAQIVQDAIDRIQARQGGTDESE